MAGLVVLHGQAVSRPEAVDLANVICFQCFQEVALQVMEFRLLMLTRMQ